MFVENLIGAFIEAVGGFFIGRACSDTSKDPPCHLRIILISFLCGLLFFAGYGAYEWFFPSHKEGVWWILAMISFAISLIAYFILLADFLIKRKKTEGDSKAD
jgi:hypothetical protein